VRSSGGRLVSALAELEGLIPDAVGEELTRLAAAVPADQAIVEVGSYKGKSTCYLAAGARAGSAGKVYAVDPWDLAGNPSGRFGFADRETRRTFMRQIIEAGFLDVVVQLQGFSASWAETWNPDVYGRIGLLYIDGDHTFRGVSTDIESWWPHLADGAVVAFDDLDTPKNPGVRQALEHHGLEFEVRAERLAVVQL
jgi:predicted O-methyltransferase YrrM